MEQPVLLFDGVCNFCNRMVNFAIRNDKKAKLTFAPLESKAGLALRATHHIPDNIDTIVFIEKGKAYTYATAAIRVCRYLDWPAKILYAFIIIPPFISQPFYKWFAKKRYKWFGKTDTCMIPIPDVKKRFLD
jgi:predicted DCC family thiol-disulfide oxidoreductase YuxK